MEGPSWDPIADHRKAANRVRKAVEKPQGQLLLTKRIAHALKELSQVAFGLWGIPVDAC